MDFLYLQRDLESKPCREILYIRCMHIMRVLFCTSIRWRSPPPYTPKTIVLLLLLQVFFKDTLYFLLKYVLLPVLFTLIQVVLLLITSTFTRVQIQSNLGTTGYSGHTAFTFVKQGCPFRLRKTSDHSTILKTSFKIVCFRFWKC